MNDDIAGLQVQVVALRLAIEDAGLSLLQPDPDPAATARRLREAKTGGEA